MKKVISLIFLLLITISAYSNSLEKNIKVYDSSASSLRDHFREIIIQTGISVILIDDKIDDKNSSSKYPTDIKLSELCNLIAGNQYQWHLIDNVLIFQKKTVLVPALQLKMQSEYCLKSLPLSVSSPIFNYLMTKDLMFMGILAEKLNYPKFIENEIFLDYLTRVVDNTNTLSLIYRISDKDARALWDVYIKQNPNTRKTGEDLFGILISENYTPQTEAIFTREDVGNGTSLVSCQLKILEKQEFEVTIKNNSNNPIKFNNFKTQDLVINDLASDGKFFEANELGMFLIYPPIDSSLPEEFYLEPKEEKVFTFPLVGSRSKKNEGKPIWSIGVEKEYDYNPNKDCTILTRRNKNYNLYGIVVYFYDETGKKYKTFNKDFIDSTGWPE